MQIDTGSCMLQQPQHADAAAPPPPPAAAAAAASQGPGQHTGHADKWWLSDGSQDEPDHDQDDGVSSDEGCGQQKPPHGHKQQQQKQQQPGDEDLLYDPNADDEDEAWVQQQRHGHATDAILSCPGCFATLCVDCQQHAFYHTQYRAMLTMNCEVKTDQVIRSEVTRREQQPRQRQQRKRRNPDGDAVSSAAEQQQQQAAGVEVEVLHPVCCAVCDTHVGAQDADEVVHFTHVLASES